MDSGGIDWIIVNSTVLFTVFSGVCVLLLIYILRVFKSDSKNEYPVKHELPPVQPEKRKEAAQKSKKKGADSKWTGRTDKQGFTHPWMVGSLKGHTDQVLDMDFSANGKYLASCAEEDQEDAPGDLDTSSSSSSSSVSSTSSVSPSPRSKGLSRRQRKNRRRDDSGPKVIKGKKFVPLRSYQKLNNMPDSMIWKFLCSYLLSPEQLLSMGYPVVSKKYDGAIIFKSMQHPLRYQRVNVKSSKFNVNAREFVPRSHKCEMDDSGQGSSSESSETEEAVEPQRFVIDESCIPDPDPHEPETRACVCVRCRSTFYVRNNSEYCDSEPCRYHPGKISRNQSVFPCCGGSWDSAGCTDHPYHVWSGVRIGLNGPYPCCTTKERRTPPTDGNYGVYALDCEMVYTMRGLEAARVTVVGLDGRLVYDAYVRPEGRVIDYNTAYSGITERHLERATKRLRDVQNDLMGFIHSETILIGHGLENDLRVLRMMHHKVIDTAVTFPHYNGLPYRHSLKFLVAQLLKKDIQREGEGHDSYEDSRCCMDLVLLRVWKDFFGLIQHLETSQ